MNLSLRLLTVFLLYAGLAQAQYIVVIPVSPSQVCAGGSVTVNYYPDSNVPTYTVTNVQLVGADNTVISPLLI